MSAILDGQVSSAGALNSQFSQLQDSGTSILAKLTDLQASTLIEFDHRLTQLQSKRVRAGRVAATGIAALFLVSDFDSINQSLTTATIRADLASASLRERHIPTSALVVATEFSVDSGMVNALNRDQTLLSVFSDVAPTGTFTLQLQETVNLSFLSLTLSAMASSPAVQVQVSGDGVVYTDAANVALNGPALSAWLNETSVRYVRITLKPSHPDDLDGETYTFGITDFAGTTATYNLVSDVYFKPISFRPVGSQLLFNAQHTGSVIYNLLLDDGSGTGTYIPVTDGMSIPVPGTQNHTQTALTVDANGVLQAAVAANAIQNTVVLKDLTTGLSVPVIATGSLNGAHAANLSRTYAELSGTSITLFPLADKTHTYELSYTSGPTVVKATLIAHLATQDRTNTPVFKGASLEAQ